MVTERRRRFGPGTWALIALGGAVLLMLAVGAVAGPSVGAGASLGYGPGGGMMPLMLLGVLLFWLAVILGIVALVRWAAELPWGRGEDASDALELARRRYARGEISREEYERLRENLHHAA